jgi:hypothetical protein
VASIPDDFRGDRDVSEDGEREVGEEKGETLGRRKAISFGGILILLVLFVIYVLSTLQF